MKQLYNIQLGSSVEYVNKKGKINHISDCDSASNLIYGETPLMEYNEISDWYDFVTYKNKKIPFGVNRFTLDCNNFVRYAESTFVNIIQPSDIHMQQLIKELPLDQFIEYMKDNGLGMESVR